MFENFVIKANGMLGMRELINYTSRMTFYIYGAEDNSLMFIKENANFYEKNCHIVESKIIMEKKL